MWVVEIAQVSNSEGWIFVSVLRVERKGRRGLSGVTSSYRDGHPDGPEDGNIRRFSVLKNKKKVIRSWAGRCIPLSVPCTHTQETEAEADDIQAILYLIASSEVANLNYKKEENEGEKGGREKKEERKEVEAGASGVQSQPQLYDRVGYTVRPYLKQRL